MLTVIRRETLMRFRKNSYLYSATARVKEDRWIMRQIELANERGIKPRVIVQAETRRRS